MPRAANNPHASRTLLALLQRQDVETATWEAFLADIPMRWLDARPVVEMPIPVGEVVELVVEVAEAPTQ